MAMDPQRLMRLATVASTSVALTLLGAKAVAWVVTDSVSMLSSLVDTSLDLVGSLITFFAVRQALVPADADHRFGHGKAEALSGLVQAGFIAASGCALLFAVVERFNAPKQVREEGVGLVISALALVLAIGLVAFQRHVVRRTGSIAIGADMAHYGTDVVATLVTGVGLFLSGQFDLPLIDSSIAGFVALYLLHGAWKIGRDSLDILMDRELPDEDRRQIEEIARRNPGVKDVHELRTRSGGATRFIQLHIDVDRNLSLIAGHDIGRQVQGEIAKAFPGAEIILHVDPSHAS
ncbi:cation diffusion facilitator family transporter [Reyranella massiliensis]|uniref:cation diffusion facilitator family transporter n=1 Tax=Reyranella massiliensis TaxID=445220 RepID=UPI0002FDDAEE|nr:cation diffusion facilitator family transporter [Reyranella massiliensis]